jgi:hypothetical protein
MKPGVSVPRNVSNDGAYGGEERGLTSAECVTHEMEDYSVVLPSHHRDCCVGRSARLLLRLQRIAFLTQKAAGAAND